MPEPIMITLCVAAYLAVGFLYSLALPYFRGKYEWVEDLTRQKNSEPFWEVAFWPVWLFVGPPFILLVWSIMMFTEWLESRKTSGKSWRERIYDAGFNERKSS